MAPDATTAANTSAANGDSHVAQAIADHTGLSVDQVNALFDQGVGYGAILKLVQIANAKGVSVDDLVAAIGDGEFNFGELVASLSDEERQKLDNTSLGNLVSERAKPAGNGNGNLDENGNAVPPPGVNPGGPPDWAPGPPPWAGTEGDGENGDEGDDSGPPAGVNPGGPPDWAPGPPPWAGAEGDGENGDEGDDTGPPPGVNPGGPPDWAPGPPPWAGNGGNCNGGNENGSGD